MSVSAEKIAQSPDGTVTLTADRVRLDRRVSGHTTLVTMTLDAVSSCGLVTRSYPILIILAVLAGAAGAYLLKTNYDNTPGGVAAAAGVVLLIAYFLTRSAALKISSAGESVVVSAQNMKRDALVQFIDAVENAKLAFLGRKATRPSGEAVDTSASPAAPSPPSV